MVSMVKPALPPSRRWRITRRNDPPVEIEATDIHVGSTGVVEFWDAHSCFKIVAPDYWLAIDRID
jgi:hypothetical protein